MVLAATILFGTGIWQAFLESADFTSTVILEAGSTGWQKIHSVFSIARSLGAPVDAAYLLHGVFVLGLVAGTLWLWRQRVAFEVQAAGLIAASVLITPYALDYDLMALAPALAVPDGRRASAWLPELRKVPLDIRLARTALFPLRGRTYIRASRRHRRRPGVCDRSQAGREFLNTKR